MDAFINMANAAACALIAAALVLVVLLPSIRDGVVGKLGLIIMALGFAGLAVHLHDGLATADYAGVERALLLINTGLVVAAVSLAPRCWRALQEH